MTVSIQHLAPALQSLFTDDAHHIARDCGFSKRSRVWTGPAFVRTLVLGWLDRPDATLAELAATLDASAQSLQQRLNPAAVSLLSELLALAMHASLELRPRVLPLLSRFNGVYVEDCTSVALPHTCRRAMPACGGRGDSRSAGLKVYLRFEVGDGLLTELEVTSARANDAKAGQAFGALPAGSLRLADMGFFDSALLRSYSEQGVRWVTRLPAGSSLRAGSGRAEPLHEFLSRQIGDAIDEPVWLGKTGDHAVRLVARRCPPEVASRRLEQRRCTAKRKGKKLTARQILTAQWTVLATNLPEEEFAAREVEALPPVRWQIELLFKRCKGIFGLDEVSCRTPVAALCQVLARLLGLVVANWVLAMRGGPMSDGNPTRAAKAVRGWARTLVAALVSTVGTCTEGILRRVAKALRKLKRELAKIGPSKRKRPTTLDRLSEAESLS